MYNPLVSVCIITYNSGNYVVETLESIKAQTYKNIELIISDDCSKDNTVNIVEHWINKNATSFNITPKLIKSPQNTGVSANLNRAITASCGTWIKSLAGDDLLTNDSIEKFVSYISIHNECQICLSRLELFPKNHHNDKIENYLESIYNVLKTNNRQRQYITSLKYHIFPGPAAFYKRELWKCVGGFDERYITEEYPFEIKVLQRTPIFFLDSALVKWRQRDNSLSNRVFSPRLELENVNFYYRVRRKLLIKEKMFLTIILLDIKNFKKLLHIKFMSL